MRKYIPAEKSLFHIGSLSRVHMQWPSASCNFVKGFLQLFHAFLANQVFLLRPFYHFAGQCPLHPSFLRNIYTPKTDCRELCGCIKRYEDEKKKVLRWIYCAVKQHNMWAENKGTCRSLWRRVGSLFLLDLYLAVQMTVWFTHTRRRGECIEHKSLFLFLTPIHRFFL